MKKIFSKKYTLVEIMMVIVLAAILFGIGIPAFSTMVQGNSMTIAIRQIGAKIQAARAYAVMNRCSVAVVFIQGTGTAEENLYSAYRVCITNDDGTAFESWIEDESWKKLPKGILDEVSNATSFTLTAANSPEFLSADATAQAIIFKKDGKATAGATITLRQGRYLNGTRVFTDGGNGIHTLTVNQYTGKVTTAVN